MLHSSIEKAIQILKREPAYRLDSALSGRILIQVLTYRGFQLARGALKQPWLGQGGKRLFLGAHAQLQHPQLIRAGRSVIIEDYVFIDALSTDGVTLGNNVTIARHVTIKCTGVIRSLGKGLSIGDNSAVGAYSFLGAQGGIQIGNNVIMGPNVSLFAENHVFDDPVVPIRLQGETRKGIIVADDCWIGAGGTILDGVRVGRGSVIAAGSVVTKDVPPYSIVGGVPAQVLKRRNQQ